MNTKNKSLFEQIKKSKSFGIINLVLLVLLTLSLAGNQYFISKTNKAIGEEDFIAKLLKIRGTSSKSDSDESLKDVDLTKITTTAQAVNAVFPIKQGQNANDLMAIMLATGMPKYGEGMGVSYDDAAGSMEKMVAGYEALKAKAKENPELWKRYLALAAAPRGISCEFCCGLGAQGVNDQGDSMCGCKHNPALQALTLWLMMNTDYNDAQILKEALKWKTLFFPKDMIELASKISGGNVDVLKELPKMVGGC
jgi:hypothetical protein